MCPIERLSTSICCCCSAGSSAGAGRSWCLHPRAPRGGWGLRLGGGTAARGTKAALWSSVHGPAVTQLLPTEPLGEVSPVGQAAAICHRWLWAAADREPIQQGQRRPEGSRGEGQGTGRRLHRAGPEANTLHQSGTWALFSRCQLPLQGGYSTCTAQHSSLPALTRCCHEPLPPACSRLGHGGSSEHLMPLGAADGTEGTTPPRRPRLCSPFWGAVKHSHRQSTTARAWKSSKLVGRG